VRSSTGALTSSPRRAFTPVTTSSAGMAGCSSHRRPCPPSCYRSCRTTSSATASTARTRRDACPRASPPQASRCDTRRPPRRSFVTTTQQRPRQRPRPPGSRVR
jgi:hypothetical protein